MALYRKTRISTLINIVGMSIAFAAAIILTVQVKWDVTFNKNFEGHEKVFRLEHDIMGEGVFSTYVCRPLIEALRTASPNIASIGTSETFGRYRDFYPEGKKDQWISCLTVDVDSALLSVFPFEWIDGSASDFSTRGTAVISESMAKSFFGNESAVGKILAVNDNYTIRIVGVYKDMPKNCSFCHDIMENIGNRNIDNRSEWSYNAYLKLVDEQQLESTLEVVKESILKLLGVKDEDRNDPSVQEIFNNIRIVNIHDAHFERDVRASLIAANRSIVITLAIIAILLILIAIMNFINFAFAEIPFHIKNINTRRVLGESRANLIRKQLQKACIIALVAFVVAVGIVYCISGTTWASFLSGGLHLDDNIDIFVFTFFVVIVSAIVAGIAPAIYSTSQPTTMVLKGSYSMSVKGKTLRSVLVSIQFILSFIFIIMAFFVVVQTRYMTQKDMGFNHTCVLQVTCGSKAGSQHEALSAKLKQNPAIIDITFADNTFVSNNRMNWTRESPDGNTMFFSAYPVQDNFIDFFGIEVVEGRGFLPSDNEGETGTFVVNETFMHSYSDMHIYSYLEGHNGNAQIVGVVRDFNFKSLQFPLSPFALYVWGKSPWRSFSMAYIKIAPNTNIAEVSDYIKETVCTFNPNLNSGQVDVQFLDKWIESMYKSELSLGNLITIASLVALIIAIIGIIGLVFFETQFLSREIAIRRVNGATVDSILRMINSKYIFMAVASFVVATPLTYVIITTWRSEFAYQAPVSAWIFAVAFALVVAITVAVVTLQSWRTANSNPVNALKEN